MARSPVPVGTAVNRSGLLDPRYRDVLNAHFAGVTPENELKWETTAPERGAFDFGPADQIVAYALAHDLSLHGHTLVWHQQLPPWLTATAWNRAQLESVLRRQITTVVDHYRGEVDEWDVINEPFSDDGSLRANLWLQVIGPDYIPLALNWAHEADPDAKLFINDYNVDWPGPKQRALLSQARRLQRMDVPLSGIGLEEHLSLTWAPSAKQLGEAMNSYARLGLEVQVTEADVDTTGFPGSTVEARAQQAAIFKRLATACRALPACTRFSVWGVSDAVSWLGTAAAGLPFDSNYEPKPAWAALLGGLGSRLI